MQIVFRNLRLQKNSGISINATDSYILQVFAKKGSRTMIRVYLICDDAIILGRL